MNMRLRLYYPSKPFSITQAWGIFNPAYTQFGFTRHNGIDFLLGTDKKLYAPCDGTVVKKGNNPAGSGIFLGLVSDVHEFEDGHFRVLIDFLHCEQILVSEGQKVKIGDILAIADNTGFSTGPHTHMQPRRIAYWNGEVGNSLALAFADKNDANGSFDPMPFFTGIHARDVPSLLSYLQALLVFLTKYLAGLPRTQ